MSNVRDAGKAHGRVQRTYVAKVFVQDLNEVMDGFESDQLVVVPVHTGHEVEACIPINLSINQLFY